MCASQCLKEGTDVGFRFLDKRPNRNSFFEFRYSGMSFANAMNVAPQAGKLGVTPSQTDLITIK